MQIQEEPRGDRIDVYRGKDPPFSPAGLAFLEEFHKRHSAIDLYGMVPEYQEIVDLVLATPEAEDILIIKESDPVVKALYQANREARAKGLSTYQPNLEELEAKSPFTASDLAYLRQYFSVTPVDVYFGQTFKEKIRIKRLDEYISARDSLAEAKLLLKKKVEAHGDSFSTKKFNSAKRDIPSDSTQVLPDVSTEHLIADPAEGATAEDDPIVGLSDDEYGGNFAQAEDYIAEEDEVKNEGTFEPNEVNMNMVLVLPSEFLAPQGQGSHLDGDVFEERPSLGSKTKEELLAIAFNEVMPRDEPNKYRHLKPLYISAHVEGIPISRIFVDCGATVNVLPYSIMRKLNKTKEDLIPSDVVMSSFVGDKSKTIGVLPLKITVADQTRVAAFYVVESNVDYNILLGRDWIHQSGCIPSSLFQLLFFWDGQKVSIHPADEKPFEAHAVQARIYDEDVGWVVLSGYDANGRPTKTSAKKALELGAENVRKDSAREVLIDLSSFF